MFYRCNHFGIWEIVDKSTYEKFGEQAWQFFNPAILISIDGVRDYFGKPVTVNNWRDGGQFQWRGLRPLSCDVGAAYGLHRFGGALDFDVKGLTAEEIRQEILKNKNHEKFKLITCLEGNVSWVHADVRNIQNRILIVYP